MPITRRDFAKSLPVLGLSSGLSGCFSKASDNGVQLTRVRLVNLSEVEDVKVKVAIEYDGEEILNQIYTVKKEDSKKTRPISITDLPQESGIYHLSAVNKKMNANSSLKITRPTYPKCSYVDVLIHDDGHLGVYVEKCGN